MKLGSKVKHNNCSTIWYHPIQELLSRANFGKSVFNDVWNETWLEINAWEFDKYVIHEIRL